MAKEPRTQISGKEARYILKQNNVNLSWLAEQIGITLETLEYCIGQSMKANRPIFNYVRIMKQHADLAIKQILEQLHQKEDASAPSTE